MPMYLYYCKECENELEMFHSMSITPEVPCKCGAKMVRGISGNIGGYARGAGSYAATYNGKNAGNARKSSKK